MNIEDVAGYIAWCDANDAATYPEPCDCACRRHYIGDECGSIVYVMDGVEKQCC